MEVLIMNTCYGDMIDVTGNSDIMSYTHVLPPCDTCMLKTTLLSV